jgi:outer membrane protein assembly factor BamB
MKTTCILALLAACSGGFTSTFAEGGWPQWRGPAFDGTAPGGSPPLEWSETKNVKWKAKIPGLGTSTPIVWKDQVFILTAMSTGEKTASAPLGDVAPAPAQIESNQPPERRRRPGGGGGGGGGRSERPSEKHQWVLMSLDRKTGAVQWQKVAREEVPHEGHHRDHGYASASPVTDGEHLYAFFGSRGLYCYDLKGDLKWEKQLGQMRTRNSFGEGASPALHGETLVVNWDHEGEDFIVALDKRTGKELWRKERDEPTTWTTPLIIEHEGRAQVIVSATNRIRSYDLKTGEIIWECGGMTTNAIPTPIARDGVLYATSGFRGAAFFAIKLGRTGDLTGTDAILWQHNKGTPYVPSPVLTEGGRLYFFSGNTGTLSCLDSKTGKVHFESLRVNELLGGVYASPVSAAGRVYLVGRDGKAVVIEDADEFKVLATNAVDDRIDASPAIVGKELYLRGHQHLYCIAE